MTGRTIADIRAKGFRVLTPHRTQPRFEITHDEPFFVAYDDGTVHEAGHTGFGYAYEGFAHGDNDFGGETPVGFDVLSRPELKALFGRGRKPKAEEPSSPVGKTLKELKADGFWITQTGVRGGMNHDSITEFARAWGSFCMVTPDGTVVASESPGNKNTIRVKGLLGAGDRVDFELLPDKEVIARGLRVPMRWGTRGRLVLRDGSIFNADAPTNVPASCMALGKDSGALDEIAAPWRYAVRLADPHPWRDTLGKAVTSGRKVGFDVDVLRPRGGGEFARLANGLIDLGGWKVAAWDENDPDTPDILSRGQLWPGAGAIKVKGRPCGCHENSSRYWARHMDDTLLVTGYALSEDDGMWRQHSWCVVLGEDGPRIVETTEPRLAYFGFVMTAEESVRFHKANTRETVTLPTPTPMPGMIEEPESEEPTFTM